ncbi:MAG: NAD(P)-dependent glycerol-3-phosphate dehydrogenase [Alphaproteobacteria bacterium]|nr:NAD(P)-dependent glycerol-3-phosphate dehydrogenase [Alphaproteobacteria bacterium]
MQRIGIIGSGAWGTALTLVAARAGKSVLMYAREEEVVRSINEKKENELYLRHIKIEDGVRATTNLKEVVTKSDILLMCVPAQYTRAVAREMKPYFMPETPLILCAKGMERKSGDLLSTITLEELPFADIAVLSGPAFASEVALKLPTAVTISSPHIEKAMTLCYAIGNKYFRPYASDDIISSQIGGALKNVIAIATGIVDGAGLGDNAKAVLMTRGLSEMTRLAKAMGGKKETLQGLCGVGDLVLSCTSAQSRNYSIGKLIGKAHGCQDILSLSDQTVEGVYTASAVMDKAKALSVEMPICESVYRVLYEEVPLEKVMKELLSRPFKIELESFN